MNFPEELVTEILSRLPVRSLLRFKCVCKSWCNLISAKDFTFLHLNNCKISDLVFAGPADTSKPWKLSIANVSLSPPSKSCAEAAATTLPFVSRSRIVDYPPPQQQGFDKSSFLLFPKVCGPCNGIFCLYRQEEERFLLWNPLIQDFKTIPQSNLPRQEAIQDYRVGFGFDSETNDYKILQIVRNTHTYQQPQQQFELYSLATNSWKKLDASPLKVFCGSCLFTTSRKICWLGNKRQVFLFDVRDETFDMIPVSLEGATHSWEKLFIEVFPFRESIAVVIHNVISSRYCEIWVLNDFSCAQSNSWSKLWAIEVESFFWPLGLCGNSYLIFRGYDSLNLKLYNLLNHDVVDVGASMFPVLVYKESLISISGDKPKKSR